MNTFKPIFICGTKEIALSLGLGVNEVRKLVKHDEFPAIKYGIKWITTQDALEQWAQKFMADNPKQHFLR